MPAKHANYWKTLLAGTLGAAAVLTPGMAYAQASGPVTAISELSDVQPTDWAFQALQSLVERYGCIAGYPDRTYRGNRAMTRFEFAAGMNACLDRINELIAAGLADKVSREDLATLQRLQEEFAAELAALRGRVDALEADVTDLKGKVFNPVTKLNAQVITAIYGSALTDDRIVDGVTVAEQDQANMTLPYRVRLNFDASFTGRDRLRIRLQARDAVTEFFDGDPGPGFGGGGGGTFTLAKLIYQFPAFNNAATIYAGISGSGVFDVFNYGTPFDALSDFADAPNSTADVPGGTMFGFRFRPGDQFRLAYSYSTRNGQRLGNGFGDSGLTGGDSAHAVELGFLPTETLELYLQFATTYLQNGDPSFLANGTSLFRGPLSVTDVSHSARVNAFSVAANWELSPRIILSGWFTTGNIDYNLPNVVPAGTIDPGDEDFNGFLFGFAFPDLFIEGAQGGVVFGQPIVTTSNDGVWDSRPFIVDVYYSFPVNEYLTLTPAAYFVSNPNGALPGDNDPTIGVGALRAVFNF
ncbi:iron uptake porin [Thermostichus vulcanus]|uniref:Carbohydrate porin n=1 Tax=Thermostichus vulcanus str. 'Rupite' TaxID=2813851 RepID=A0ABT0CES4_THEVL|nr:iron uptake porin [Thermostichus vulcanus]MCJ2544292.1 carbohydrate porin [Thermostichus vulcanus str. 'Rupite']